MCPILSQRPGLWHTLLIMPALGILFLSIKLYRQPVKLLTGRTLKTSLCEPLMSMLRCGMSLCGSPRVWIFGHLGGPMLGIKASPLAELTQLNWENGVDIPGTVQSFNTLKDSDLLDSDWLWSGIYWVAPNGTHWLCATPFWTWVSPEWSGSCTLTFPWAQRNIYTTVTTNFPLLSPQGQVGTFCFPLV